MSTLEDLQRQLKELQERDESRKRENEELRREKEEAEARADVLEHRQAPTRFFDYSHNAEQHMFEKLRREKEEAEARADVLEHRQAPTRFLDYIHNVEQQMFEKLRREKEEAEARADVLEHRQAPTRFLDYIRNVEQHMFTTFSIETDPNKNSSYTTMSVEGKFYPQHFQPWTDFVAVHSATFNTFTTAFADNAYFPALTYVESLGQDLSPKVANELGVRPFIRASIEKPAATVVSKYLEIAGHEDFKAVKFKNNLYGITLGTEDLLEPARKRRSPVKDIGVPDRWLLAYHRNDEFQHTLVGEIKPAHVLNGAKINRVMSAPGDDFFLRATRQEGVSISGQVPGEVYVAKAICQAFHYMITSGLQFGYVATGEGLIFLRVPEEDPNTLYYFGSVFPVNQDLRVAATREPHETAMAQLATLCMLSVGSTQRSSSWIGARDGDLKRWPKSKKVVPSLADMPLPALPHDRGSGGGGSGGGSGGDGGGGGESGSGTQSTLKRPHSHGSSSSTTTGSSTTGVHGAQQARSVRSFVVEPPTLPYCTQACLRSLCYGGMLDDMCPNTKLHRVVARNKNHALTTDEVRTRVVAQLAENMDKDCKSLLFDGRFGRCGVLFKITITGFGYTFVAKAVLAGNRDVLQYEAAIYTALQDFQGWLIPVCLGVIDLERPIPLRNCQSVSYMMLMSYAGPDICSQTVPPGVDFELEAEKTRNELYAAGLLNDDIHEGNLAWNEEVLRVVQFDFDNAYIQPVREPPAAPGPLPQRSPLRTKRHLNAFNEGNKWGGEGHMEKRLRTAI